MNLPSWLKSVGTVVAVLVAGLLLAGELSVAYRATRPPEGYDQPRVHLNTKNSTRFAGGLAQVAAQIARAVYPATSAGNTPEVVVLYDPQDWQGGLSATSLLRPLNAVLLPAVEEVGAEIDRLAPEGNALLDGVQVLVINQANSPRPDLPERRVAQAEVLTLLAQAGAHPAHALVVDAGEPATAMLAAPWAAWSGDAIVFDVADAPQGVPVYALGEAAADGVTRISAHDSAALSVAFARYEDPANPLFGWGMNAGSLTGYRAYTLARENEPAVALMSANLARRGKPGPLLWAGERQLPQVVNDYLWSQRAAYWATPSEGPFHHFWVLGGTDAISFPAQSQADYAVEIGPYRMKGAGLAGMDMLATAWVALGIASAVWILVHEARFLPGQTWVMRLAWPLLALALGPFGIPFYLLAYRRPAMPHDGMMMWDRPLWLQGLVATASAVGFGGALMVSAGYVLTVLGLPLIPSSGPLFWLGAPMVLVMILNYVVAVLVSWPLFQTPMLAMFHGRSYGEMLPRALPVVLISMASVSLAMFPGMWALMMWNLPMMPSEESILWFGVMFFTVFLGFLISWPVNYLLIRRQVKSGLM